MQKAPYKYNKVHTFCMVYYTSSQVNALLKKKHLMCSVKANIIQVWNDI